MKCYHIASLNRRLTALAKLHGLTAAASITSDLGHLKLQASDSVYGQGRPDYTEEMLLSELERLGPIAVAIRFMEAARRVLEDGV